MLRDEFTIKWFISLGENDLPVEWEFLERRQITICLDLLDHNVVHAKGVGDRAGTNGVHEREPDGYRVVDSGELGMCQLEWQIRNDRLRWSRCIIPWECRDPATRTRIGIHLLTKRDEPLDGELVPQHSSAKSRKRDVPVQSERTGDSSDDELQPFIDELIKGRKRPRCECIQRIKDALAQLG